MNAAIGSISSKLMVLCITKILQSSMADCGNKLTMAIELNLPWFFSWRKGRILNRREYGFVTLQTNFIFESTKTWQKPLFSLPLLWNTTFHLDLYLWIMNNEGVLNFGLALQLIDKGFLKRESSSKEKNSHS